MDTSGAWGLASDAELIAAVRADDADAFAALRERHRPAAEAVAAANGATEDEANRVVADAFDRIGRDLRTGDAPDLAFRSHLCAVVGAATARTAPTEQLDGLVTALTDGLDHDAVVAAYRSLFQRWREVLWYLDVEGLEPAAVAPVLGLSAGATADLAIVARRGLRQAYRRQQEAGTELGDVGQALRGHVAPALVGSTAAIAVMGIGFGGAVAEAAEAPQDGVTGDAVATVGGAGAVGAAGVVDAGEAAAEAGGAAPVAVVPAPAPPMEDLPVEDADALMAVDAPADVADAFPADDDAAGIRAAAVPVGAGAMSRGTSRMADPGTSGLVVAASSGVGMVALGLFLLSTMGAFDPTPTYERAVRPGAQGLAPGFAAAPVPLGSASEPGAEPLAEPPVAAPNAVPMLEPQGQVLAFTGDDGGSVGTAATDGTAATGAPVGDGTGALRTDTRTPVASATPGRPAVGARPTPVTPGRLTPPVVRPTNPPVATPGPTRPPVVAPRPAPPVVAPPRPAPPVVAPPRPAPPVVAPPRPAPPVVVTPPPAPPVVVTPPPAPPVVVPPRPAPPVVAPPRPAPPVVVPPPPAPPVVQPDPVVPPDDEDDEGRGNGNGRGDGNGNGNGNGNGAATAMATATATAGATRTAAATATATATVVATATAGVATAADADPGDRGRPACDRG